MKTNKKKLKWFLIYLILALLIHISQEQGLKILFISVIFYSTYYVKSINPHLLYLSVCLVFYSVESPVGILIATLPAYLNSSLIKMKPSGLQVIGIICFLIITLFSYYFGIETTMSTMLVFYSCIIVFIEMMNEQIDLDEFYQYVVLMACIVAVILLSELLGGGITIRYGRLALYDNIRRLANTISIPTFMSFAMLSIHEGTRNKKILYLIVGTISSFILFLTLSKGALIATVIGLLIVYYWPKKKKFFSFQTLFLPLLLIVIIYFVISYAENFGMFHFDRLTEEDEGFNGRTEIWEGYYNLMKTDISYFLFGLGPGDLTRLYVNGFYAHSLFLDTLFSYGLTMALLWIIVLYKIVSKIIRSKSTIAIGLFTFSCFLVATHGNATFMSFYILIAVAYKLSGTRYVLKET